MKRLLFIVVFLCFSTLAEEEEKPVAIDKLPKLGGVIFTMGPNGVATSESVKTISITYFITIYATKDKPRPERIEYAVRWPNGKFTLVVHEGDWSGFAVVMPGYDHGDSIEIYTGVTKASFPGIPVYHKVKTVFSPEEANKFRAMLGQCKLTQPEEPKRYREVDGEMIEEKTK